MNLDPSIIAVIITSAVSSGLFFGIMRSSLNQHAEILREVREGLAQLHEIKSNLAVHSTKILMSTEQLTKHASIWPKFDSRIKVLEEQMQSQKEFRKVMRSSQSWKTEDEDK